MARSSGPNPGVATKLSPSQIWTIVSASWAVAMIAGAFAFVGPVLSLTLEARTGSGEFIGLFATVGAITTVAMTPVAPWLMRHVPGSILIAGACVAGGLCFPIYYWLEDPLWWFVIRFVQGVGLTAVFVVGETWVNDVTPNAVRARVLSIYAIFLAGGMGLGAAAAAAIIHIVGVEGWQPFAIGAAIAFAGGIPFAIGRQIGLVPPSQENARFRTLLGIIKDSPGLMATVFAFASVEFALFHFLPVYGVRLGFTESRAALLLFALPIGNLLLQYPIGVLADRLPRASVLRALFAACVILPVVTALNSGASYYVVMALFAAFIGTATGLYTLGLSILAERYGGGKIAAANSAFILCYGLGSLASPYAIGRAMDVSGPDAMLWVMAIVVSVGAIVYVAAERRREVDLKARGVN